MPLVARPRLRSLEMIPVGSREERLFVLRDPEGFGRMVALPDAAALLAMLMDGRRTLPELQSLFHTKVGIPVRLSHLRQIVRKLDEARLLAGKRFERHRRRQIASYLASRVRPATHAGGAYAGQPDQLRQQLAELFTCQDGPGPIDPRAGPNGRPVCALLSPHIDPHRGGATFAWAYKRLVEESDADLFVIFGTAHSRMRQWFSVSRKDFDTPLGVVRTSRRFINVLARRLASSVAGQQVQLFQDELAHRMEHSIEFQAMFLQYVLGGKRRFRIVPVLTNSFREFIDCGLQPDEAPEVQAFIVAMRAAEAQYPGRICYISGADLAHLGQRFGDQQLLDQQRLAEQSEDDRRLLERACRCDSAGFFNHVAGQNDCNRVCGLSPTYVMLQVIQPARGELLRYDQAVEPDGTSCVSFASMAFYRQ